MADQLCSYGAFLILLLAFLLAILACFFFSSLTNKRCLPPSPPAYPIIGHLHLLGKLPHQDLCQIAKKYGPLVLLKFGSHPTLIASSPAMAMEFLKIHDRNFASRPIVLAATVLHYNQKDIAFAEYGEHWKLMRKFLTMELLTSKRLEENQHIRREEILSMMRMITEQSKQGEEVNISKMISIMSVNVIARIVMGKRAIQGAELSGLLSEFVKLVGEVSIADLIPQLWWLDLQEFKKRLHRLHVKLDLFLEQIIGEHRLSREEGYIPDYIDALLDMSIDGMKLEKNDIKAMIQDVLLGGTDTSTNTVEWAMSELIRAPSILRKAQEELDQTLGKHGVIEESCLDNLKYLRAIVKETLRLHPPLPLLVPHKSMENCKVAGYDIQKGTRLLVNVWAIGRDPLVWERPLEFDPDRFMNSRIDIKGQNFELIPFGSGRRACPGLAMGMRIVEYTLAHLLYGFEWKVKDEVDMGEGCGITVGRAKPLLALATTRANVASN